MVAIANFTIKKISKQIRTKTAIYKYLNTYLFDINACIGPIKQFSNIHK